MVNLSVSDCYSIIILSRIITVYKWSTSLMLLSKGSLVVSDRDDCKARMGTK